MPRRGKNNNKDYIRNNHNKKGKNTINVLMTKKKENADKQNMKKGTLLPIFQK